VVGQDVRLRHQLVSRHPHPPFIRAGTCPATEDVQSAVPDEY
jgi:hypothetical protein